MLANNDTVEVGKYKIKFLLEETGDYEKTMIMKAGSGAASMSGGFGLPSSFGSLGSPAINATPAAIKVLTGAAAGREVSLTKVVTTVGKPGVQVASITKRPSGYVFAHVEGMARPNVNGIPLTGESIALRSGDLIELAGTQMQFIQG